MTFTPERIDWSAVVIPDFLLLCIVTDAHSDVTIAMTTVWTSIRAVLRMSSTQACLPPNIERQLETGDENPLVQFTCPISQSMLAFKYIRRGFFMAPWSNALTSVGVQALVLVRLIIGRIILIES